MTAKDMVQTLIQEQVPATLKGPTDLCPTVLAPLSRAVPYCLTFYVGDDAKQIEKLTDCVLLCQHDFDTIHPSVSRIMIEDPRLGFAILGQEFLPPGPAAGIHPTATVDPQAVIAASVSIGPHCVIGNCRIGEGSVIHAGVTIHDNTTVGTRVEIESNAVIGAPGVGRAVAPDGRHWLFPHVGGVTLEDETYVGACSIITRGVMDDTVLQTGSRVNASVVVAHNCTIGRHTVLSIGVMISGSCTIGEGCFIGTNACLREGITLGNNIVVGMGSVVTKNFPDDGIIILGNPARLRPSAS